MKPVLTLIVPVVLLGCSRQEAEPPQATMVLPEGTYAIQCIPKFESLHNPGETVMYDIGGEMVAGPDPEMGERLSLSDAKRFAVFRTELPVLRSTLSLHPDHEYTFVLRARDHALLEVRLGVETVYRWSPGTNSPAALQQEPFVAKKHGETSSEQSPAGDVLKAAPEE